MMIPYGRQNINEDDLNSVISVLKSDFLTQGPAVPSFEKSVSDYVGSKYAYAVNSATSGLHLACIALGVGPGDRVWTSPISFVASANCALYCGASVDFVDIDPITYNLSADRLEEKLIAAEKNGLLPKVVIPVHLAGQSCDMERISLLGKRFGFRIIEDASHAIGGSYKSTKVGSCLYSDITVFSFHPVKIITSGEGGMVTTNDDHISEHIYRMRSHGITRNPQEMTKPADGPWYYQQIELGYNYRMTDIQAALGFSQMTRLDEFVKRRHEIFQSYKRLLGDLDLKLPTLVDYAHSALHLYVIRVPNGGALKVNRKELFERLRLHNVIVNVHYIPIYSQPYYTKFGYDSNQFPEAEAYYSEAISLPMYPDLTDSQLEYVRESLVKPIGH